MSDYVLYAFGHWQVLSIENGSNLTGLVIYAQRWYLVGTQDLAKGLSEVIPWGVAKGLSVVSPQGVCTLGIP